MVPGTLRGIGDDAALLDCPGEVVTALASWIDSSSHRTGGEEVAKALVAESVAALSASNAQARWFFLSITLPEHDAGWLEGFATSLHQQLDVQGATLAGGDTTHGPLAIDLTAMGMVGNA